ncbi:MAG: alcohol dehydrogenase catalytic domain-containing protein [Aquabacterium sp.]|nr:alcohol dehydrogenase catalytic domain-containing protein [Aquabacterium sp.]
MALVCQVGNNSTAPCLRWVPVPRRTLGHDEVRVTVRMASVNPIDVKRAGGYGQRILSLMGAGGRTLVLGNDFAGVVADVGRDVADVLPGDRVWGLVPTGGQGSHRSEVCVPSRWVRPLPRAAEMTAVVALPYTFTTLWRALKAIRLHEHNAAGRHVLVNGAGGALGQLAIQLLSRWGAQVTAVCSQGSATRCLALGAAQVIDRHNTPLAELPSVFDATLNFGAWADEAGVVDRLHRSALGHATTVHPLLADIDAQGWLRGSLSCWRSWRGMYRRVHDLAPQARYAWVVFKPDEDALNTIEASLLTHPLQIDVAHRAPFHHADSAFAHVGQGHPTRAVLVSDL